MLRSGFGVAGVPWAIAAGTATHLVGDMLTDEGIPIAWPLSRVHFRLLPEPLAFTTGTRPERWVVAPLMLAALVWLVALVEKVVPAGRLPLH
jgi:LexA-binding, inner membrane-associated putative hydrolase